MKIKVDLNEKNYDCGKVALLMKPLVDPTGVCFLEATMKFVRKRDDVI